jgi:hypothetical protein
MHRRGGSVSHISAQRIKEFAKPVLLASAVAALGLTIGNEARALERWKHPLRPAVGALGGGAQHGPNFRAARESGLEPRRDTVAPGANEPRSLEPTREIANPAERIAPDLQRQGAGAVGQQGVQRGPQPGSFARGALTARLRAPAGFGRSPLPGRFQQLGRFQPRAIARRPLIGEPGFTGAPAAGETRFRNNEMVFHVDRNVSPQAVDAVARRLGLTTIASQGFGLSGGTIFRFRITDGRPVADAVRALENEHIGTAQPNYVFKLQQDATQPSGGGRGDATQYIVSKLDLIEVHRIAIGSDVPIAVIDSEIDARHPELAGAVAAEFDAIHNHDKPHTHGTGMAGAIAAHRRLVGVAPGVRILAIHAFSSSTADSAEATSAHILAGIDWAIQKGARIINMSFAGPDDPMLQLALQKARDKGVILISAAGNQGPNSPPLYPAADPNVIAVTATDANDKLLPEANQGSYITLAAPGVDVLEPAPGAGYQLTSGTSVAAAHVSGVAALLLDRNPKLDAAAVRDVLTSTARDPTHKGQNDQFGFGIVDPARALKALDSRLVEQRGVRPVVTPAAADAGPVSAR